MTSSGARLRVAIFLATLVACDDGHGAGIAADTPDARRLDGTWTIELRVDRLRFEATTGKAASRSISGEIALVANHWLAGGDDLPRPTHFGTYDIDFSTLGFDPRHDGELPRAAARIRGRDSVEIVLEPDDARESIHLAGVWRADSIAGRWSLDPVRTGGDAAGTYTMSRRIKY